MQHGSIGECVRVFKTCAVVGSSGLLLARKLGKEIDAHDAVIRFNRAPTKGFEEYTGGRTTVRFVNRQHFGFRERPSEIVLQQATTPEIVQQLVSLKQEMPATKTFMVAPDFHRFVVSDLVKPATNGFYGMVFAMQVCDVVSLYGIFRGTSEDIPYHYFNSEEPVAAQHARDVDEMLLILQMISASDGRLRFRDPCQHPSDCTSNLACESCPAGSMCNCEEHLPVPRPGFCSKSDELLWTCFARCTRQEDCAAPTQCSSVDHENSCAPEP